MMPTPPTPRQEDVTFQAASDAIENRLCDKEFAETNEKQVAKTDENHTPC